MEKLEGMEVGRWGEEEEEEEEEEGSHRGGEGRPHRHG
jgi:hypothetical protein